MEKQERRTARQVDVPAPVLGKVKNGKPPTVQAEGRDCSVGGLFFYLHSSVQEGSTLELVFPIPQDKTVDDLVWVRCHCRVVRVEEGGPDRKRGVGAVIEQCERLGKGEIPQV